MATEEEDSLIPPEDSAPHTLFEAEAKEPLSKMERRRKYFDRTFGTTLRVIWSDWRARIGIFIIIAFSYAGLVGPYIISPTNFEDGPILMLPFVDWNYPLGTDGHGQDLLSLLVHGTPTMLLMMFGGGAFTILVGTTLGTIAGFDAESLDSILMTVSDIAITIPGLPLLLVILSVWAPENVILLGVILVINNWGGLARSVRSEVLKIRNETYVEASRLMGIKPSRIIRRDILPNIMPYVLINFVQAARSVIYASVGLYFLGILPRDNSNWGVVLDEAYSSPAITSSGSEHWVIFPLFTIILITFGLILLSQGSDRLFNPRVRARHAKSIEGDDEYTSE